MQIKINGVEIAAYPDEFSVTTMDLDGESSTRAADGTLNRDKIATKRQIDMSWGLLGWAATASVLKSISSTFFDVYYPDPEAGAYVTKTFYAGNRPCPVAVAQDNKIYWKGLKVTLTER